MKTWKINTVRIPLNEDCWLGINNAPQAYSGVKYQTAIAQYVALLAKNGCYAILDLHWSAPGTDQATVQVVMADADHSPLFWTQVATAYANHPRVLFDLFNEANLGNADWDCWRNGGTCAPTANTPFKVAGMKTLYQAVRSTGANNVVIMAGLQNANDFEKWVSKVEQIPDLWNVGGSWHAHDYNSVQTGCPSQYNGYGAQLLGNSASVTASQSHVDVFLGAGYPVVMGESGISPVPGDRSFSEQQILQVERWYDNLMTWMDARGQGYAAWAWNIGGNPILIQDYNGTPALYGEVTFKAHLAKLSP